MSKKHDEELMNLDKRIISRKISKGEFSEKELQAYLKSLPDVSENGEEITLNENEK